MRRATQVMLIVSVAVFCGVGISCHNEEPTQPPSKPGHTTITFQATFTSIRWCRLQWSNDSTASSHKYLLLRDGRDTVFNDTVPSNMAVKVLPDTTLKPGTAYSYWVYRIVNGQRWDSATVNVRTLDTSSDQIAWTLTRICKASSTIRGIATTAPGDFWMSGWMPNDSGIYQLLHIKGGELTFIDLNADADVAGCFARSDTDVWVCGHATLYHYKGDTTIQYSTGNDSLPLTAMQYFASVWQSPDGQDLFVVGGKGLILHRHGFGAWEVQESGVQVDLYSIMAFSTTDIWVGGGNGYEGDLLHYDGTQWSLILRSVPPDSVVNVSRITGVWGETTDSIWIIGNGIYHRSLGGWQDRTPASDVTYLHGIYSKSWNNIVACGAFGLVLHFDGEHWTRYDQFLDMSSDLVLNGVVISGNEVYVVGADGKSSVLLHGTF